MAVMLIGTLLMLSSRRVAVTTISSRPPVAAAGAAAESWAVASVAAAPEAASTPAPKALQKSNNWRRTSPVTDLERVADIASPGLLYGQITTTAYRPDRQ